MFVSLLLFIKADPLIVIIAAATVNWQAFAVAAIVSVMLALMTVGIQALRATLINPASILKSE